MAEILSIGEMLKSRREERGLSLEKVFDETKITTEYLTALEDNSFDVFPNKVYARSFLRDYANFLALDSKELLFRLEQEYDFPAASPEDNTDVNIGMRRLVVSFIVLVLLCAVSYGVFLHDKKDAKINNKMASVTRTSKTGIKSADAETSMPKKDAIKDTPKPKPGVNADYSNGVTLKLSTFSNCWVRVIVDGNVEYQGELPMGNTKIFYAQTYVKVRAGNSSSIQMRINGRLENDMGDPQKPITRVYYVNTPETKPAIP